MRLHEAGHNADTSATIAVIGKHDFIASRSTST
jgi:hypothetical protein